MDRAALTALLVISLAMNGIVVALVIAGRLGWVRQRRSVATPVMASRQTPLVAVMAPTTTGPAAGLPPGEAGHAAVDDLVPGVGDDAPGRRAWFERAEALVTESLRQGQPTTVVLLELLSPVPVEPPKGGGADQVAYDSTTSWLQATVRARTRCSRTHRPPSASCSRTPTRRRQARSSTGASSSSSRESRGRAHRRMGNPIGRGLDVALRLAEARLAGRREGWIRSVAVR